jgi:hypothetical protein
MLKKVNRIAIAMVSIMLLTVLLSSTAYANHQRQDDYDLNCATIILPQDEFVYTGEAIKPRVSVIMDDTQLFEGTDYIVKYSNNRNAGKASVMVSGKGRYHGKRIEYFSIDPVNLDDCSFEMDDSIPYTGKAVKPRVKVYLNGSRISKKYLTVSYYENVEIGDAYAIVDGKKNCTGQKRLDFSISVTGDYIASYANSETFLGIPYVYGGTTMNGFDCSGFVQFVYNHFGYSLPRVASDQGNVGTDVAYQDLMPGDLVFFNGYGHVGIYVGDGCFVHSPSTGDVIKVSSFTDDPYSGDYYENGFCGAVRII